MTYFKGLLCDIPPSFLTTKSFALKAVEIVTDPETVQAWAGLVWRTVDSKQKYSEDTTQRVPHPVWARRDRVPP